MSVQFHPSLRPTPLSVFGELLIPQEEARPHSEKFLTLWSLVMRALILAAWCLRRVDLDPVCFF